MFRSSAVSTSMRTGHTGTIFLFVSTEWTPPVLSVVFTHDSLREAVHDDIVLEGSIDVFVAWLAFSTRTSWATFLTVIDAIKAPSVVEVLLHRALSLALAIFHCFVTIRALFTEVSVRTFITAIGAGVADLVFRVVLETIADLTLVPAHASEVSCVHDLVVCLTGCTEVWQDEAV